MPRRNNGKGVRRGWRDATQRGKGRKRRGSWHQGNGSDSDVLWSTHGQHLPATGAEADPTQAAPARIHTSSDRRGGPRGGRLHGEAL